MQGRVCVKLGIAAVSLFLCLPVQAQTWRPIGPSGGDVRSLTAAPDDARILFLGTPDGHVFGSRDGGEHWALLGRAGTGQDDVVMALVVDSRNHDTVYAGTWTLGPHGGAVYRSTDGGHNWQAMGLQGETVRALAQSQTDPNLFIAGTITGVYRSHDSGRTWQRISPQNHEDLRNFDSVAIDPQDANVIYAGTYHLAWKTVDGGQSWQPIHAGMHDDSDVMSLGVDSKNPAHIVASACSGAYQSLNGGAMWQKFKGIGPHAYRTQLIRLDPQNSQEVYAGTTSGLWRTLDGGATWKLLTPNTWSIAALVIDPKNTNRLVIGTDRNGVEISEDGGKTYHAANEGFNHRQIVDMAVDPAHPERALVVLTNAVDAVLATRDGGHSWATLGPGFDAVKLRHVYAASDAWLATLSSGGFLRYDEAKHAWTPVVVAVAPTAPAATASPRKGSQTGASAKTKAASPRAAKPAPVRNLVVSDLAFDRNEWLAATDEGLLSSRDRGVTWKLAPSTAKQAIGAVRFSPEGDAIWIVSAAGFGASHDDGKTWTSSPMPFSSQGRMRMHTAAPGTILVASEHGLFLSSDAGANWREANLPDLAIRDAAIAGDSILVSTEHAGLFLSADLGEKWTPVNSDQSEGHIPVLASHLSDSDQSAIWAASSTEGLSSFLVDAHSQESSHAQAAAQESSGQAAQAQPAAGKTQQQGSPSKTQPALSARPAKSSDPTRLKENQPFD